MTGLELMAALKEHGNDFDLYSENKLAEVYDIAKRLIEDHKSNNHRYTDAGHSNCISALNHLVNNMELDASTPIEFPPDDNDEFIDAMEKEIKKPGKKKKN